MLVGIIGWVVTGLLIGFIISKILDLHGDDPRLGLGAAAVGAVIAAALYTVITGAGVSAFNVWSLIFAAGGAGVALATWHLIRSRSVSRAPYTRRRSY